MKALSRAFLFALAAVPLAATAAHASTWEIDNAHSEVGFTVKHMMVTNVHGSFAKFSGTLNLDDKDISKSNVQVTIDAASVDTRNEKRDSHLRSADFFDVEHTPQLTFKSTKIEKDGDKLKITGDLTMRGVTKSVVLTSSVPSQEVKDPMGNYKVGFSAKTTINRSEWGLKWNKSLEAGGLLVSDEVTLNLDTQWKKTPATKS